MSDDFRGLFPQYDELRQLTGPLKEMQQHLSLLGDAHKHLGKGSEMMEFLRQEEAKRKTILGLTDLTNIARDFERHRALLEGPIEQARRLGLLDPYSDIRKSIDAATALQQAHRDLFRLPGVAELDRIAREAMGRTDLVRTVLGTESHLKTAMEAMRSPWLQQEEIFGSATAFSNIIAMGRGINSLRGFSSEFTEALRPSLGDWRDVLTPATELLIDSSSRSRFYVDRGFDPQLTDFTPQAFEEGLEIAGLRESESAENEDDQQDSFARAKEAFDALQRFEVAIRRFIMRVMRDAYGDDWMKRQLPPQMFDKWVEKRDAAVKAGQGEHPLIDYADFTDYKAIIERKDNWSAVFKPVFGRPEDMRESFQRLFPVRIATMHARLITQDDELLLLFETKRLLKAIERK